MSRTPRNFDSNQEKMRQLIQYISQCCADQSNYGKTKLLKTLYFADSLHFLRYGEPITGWKYIRMPHGPFPDNIESELNSMIDAGLLPMQMTRRNHLYQMHKPVNLQEPDLDEFSPQEIDVVNYVIHKLETLSGTNLSEFSHLGAWKFARQGEEIPYESFHLDTTPLTETEMILGREVARKHDLLA